MRQALTNLIFNAVDALPQGGVITLASRLIERPSTAESDHSVPHLQVEVRDNGIGMDEKTRQHCLEPFFSTKAQRGGTGLGLAMVYGMMRRHEGTIEIESTTGRGTCVRLTFPFRQAPASAIVEPRRESSAPRSLRILCIDDEPLIREMLRDCLSRFNHTVAAAPNGREGLEMFHVAMASESPFQVVITDLGMPEVDGRQVARTIKAKSPQTPVIMMTGWGTMIREEGQAPVDVDAIVGKPPRIAELGELVLQVAR